MATNIHNHQVNESVDAENFENDQAVERREHVQVVHDNSGEYREKIVENVGATRRAQLRKAEQFVWLVFSAIEILIGLRFLLKMIGANPEAPFAQMVYGFSDMFLWPFFGLTAEPGFNGMVIEISSLIAMIVYAVLAWGITKLLYLIFTPSSSRRVAVFDEKRR